MSQNITYYNPVPLTNLGSRGWIRGEREVELLCYLKIGERHINQFGTPSTVASAVTVKAKRS